MLNDQTPRLLQIVRHAIMLIFMLYTTRHISELFNLGASTVKKYTINFAPFLSPEAAPTDKGKHRFFTTDDLRVFSLIVDYRNRGATLDEIYLALNTGQRGDLPPSHAEYSLVVESKDQLILLQNRVQQLEAEMESLRGERDKRLQLEAQLKQRDDDIERARQEIRALYREIAILEAEKGD